ncbi:MAG: 23S rRNA (uracil(1939)-C(5))-methyltransferase RlmD [Deltaproteobacteria bacterium]|nr:23S rRNA (uracil(1939)-C(5))-methyltransferase RlmD [Deltaproteobacteria bacterium]
MKDMANSGDRKKSGAKISPELKNGDRLTVTVTDLTVDGYGTASHNNVVIHIPDTAPGDTVSIRIDHVSHQSPHAWARIASPPQRGDKWKRHFCPESEQAGGRCGGCPLGHVSRDVYRETKLKSVTDAFAEWGIDTVPDGITMESMRRYRNKSNFVVHKQKNGTVQLGSWAPGSHRFAGMNNCVINTRPISKIQRDLEMQLTERNAPVHPTPNGIRYITVKSFESGATLVDLVVSSDHATDWIDFAQTIINRSQVHGVSITCNNQAGNQVRTGSAVEQIGRNTLCEQFGAIQLWMKATTFFQLNNQIAQKMYDLAAEWCSGANTVWDLYCGIGGLGITAAATSQCTLFGCDSVRDSIALAQRNAKANSLDAVYETIDLSTSFPADWPLPDTVLINPPRRGIDERTLARLCEIKPAKLIYMSCHPKSFARDAKTLCDQGYTLAEVAAFDMLPNTSHVELLGRFETRPTTDENSTPAPE